jgi:hypothetical protein
LAVRAYAIDPSEENAVNVEVALKRIRHYRSLAIWSQMKSRWLDDGTVPQYKKSWIGQARGEKNENRHDLLSARDFDPLSVRPGQGQRIGDLMDIHSNPRLRQA